MYTKQQIIDDIQRIASTLGTQSLKQKDFQKRSKISLSTVRERFGSWNAAVEKAGLIVRDSRAHLKMLHKKQTISDRELLEDLIRLYNEHGREPTYALVSAKGRYSIKPYKKRWGNLQNAFFLAKKQLPEAISQELPDSQNSRSTVPEIKTLPTTIKPKARKTKRTIYGEPIDFRGLRFAPVNEQGVVYLFGMISHELGYLIESVKTAYPDCEGKRCFDKEKNQWEHVRIEFEYSSSNFKEHGHNEEGCDLIVCWIDDWPECPIEILELRSVIKYL